MNKILLIIVIALIIIPIIILNKNLSAKSSIQMTKPFVSINNNSFKIDVARTTEEKIKGLSGKTSLPQNAGMLFVFDKPDIYDFWMRDMKFPLDIVWIYNDKIVTIVDNLQPTSETNLMKIPRFKSVLPADKVLEVNAGIANKYNLKVGDKVIISL